VATALLVADVTRW